MPGSTFVVIGAGAAGASIALRLARAGLGVTVIESRPFPRAKVCGEFISPAATPDLLSVMNADELRNAGAKQVRDLTLELGDRTRTWAMPEPAWALSRRTLDQRLLYAAEQAGARVLQPYRVEGVDYASHSVRVRLAGGETLEAEAVIHADGSGRHDPAGPTPTARGLVGLKCHARTPEPIHGIRMRAAQGAYCGAIGVEDNLVTFAMCATPAALARHRGDRDALLASVWPGYCAAQRTGDWMACGVARSGVISPAHPRSFRIGNAAAAVDPVGGEGIGLALWSAARLTEGLSGEASFEGCQRELHRLYTRRLRSRAPACRAAAEVLLRPGLLAALWPALALPSLTIKPWYALTGKPVGAR